MEKYIYRPVRFYLITLPALGSGGYLQFYLMKGRGFILECFLAWFHLPWLP